MLGLYVHIPFCAAICNYCNFNRGLDDVELRRRYVAALCREIRYASTATVALGYRREQIAHAISLAVVPNIALNQTRSGSLSM